MNIGYLSLRREFTQTIRVKGADLEKMPFVNLSDAIAQWFFGAYTQPASLIYVVDGNPVTDVNSYSVYDIDEVILVQNAAALATTASGQQEMVFVRTKRGGGKSGLTAAVQSGLVNVSGYHPKAGWFQNIYAGGYRNWNKVRAGLSVNYMRDVFPDTVGRHEAVTPKNLQRWRLRGFVDWQIGHRNLVELTVNYTPQRIGAGGDSIVQPSDICMEATVRTTTCLTIRGRLSTAIISIRPCIIRLPIIFFFGTGWNIGERSVASILCRR